MRKVLPLLIALTVFLTPLYPVYAQKDATSPAQIKYEKLEGKMLSLKERIASKEAEFKKKIAKFKDKKKAERIEKINTNLNQINERRTIQMQKTLERISAVLERLKEITNNAEDSGKDVSDVNSAISETETKWKEAEAALKLQMEKDYSVTVNSESTVKEDASVSRDALKTDLKSVHTLIIDTKQSLAKAISTAVSTAKGAKNESE